MMVSHVISKRPKGRFLCSSTDFLKGSASRLTILPKRRTAMPE